MENVEVQVPVTEEQYQLLRDSILSDSLEQMNEIRRRNAWLMLDAMAEIGFVENTYPGESGVSLATAILEMLEVGEIKEVTSAQIDPGFHDLDGVLIMKIETYDSSIYYVWYNQTLGLRVVRKDSEDGEVIYDNPLDFLKDFLTEEG